MQYYVIIMDLLDFNIFFLLWLPLKVTLEALLWLHCVLIIQEPAKALVFSATLLCYPIELYLHLRQSLEPGRSKLTTVEILAAPRRNLNLSLIWQVQSCTWSSMISSVLISPPAEKCCCSSLAVFLESHGNCANPHLKPKYSTDPTNYKRISVNRKINMPFGILIKPRAYINWVWQWQE